MTRETYKVTVKPEGLSTYVIEGTSVVEAAGQAGVILNTPCGGRGTCGRCRIIVHGDVPPPGDAEKKHLTGDEVQRGVRLACRMHVDRDLVLTIPAEARFFEQIILTEGRETAGHHHEPSMRKRFLQVPRPRVEDLRCDADRIIETLSESDGDFWMDVPLLRLLPGLLRDSDFSLTAVLDGSEIVAFEPGDTSDATWGVAFDIGTTTLAGSLVNLNTGRMRSVASRTNPQVRFGDDVVSRIRFAQEEPGGLERLQKCIAGALNEIIAELADTNSIDTDHIYELSAAGNTTMSHLLLGIDPSAIAAAPYVSVFRDAVDVKAASLGIECNPNANMHLLPNLAGFVGSDTVAVAMASRLDLFDGTAMAIDIGTNGEIVIGNGQKLIACSCAAGPAFEGARIRQGMRAAEGAINKVVINDRIEISVIGGGRPCGICGSGLLDAVASLLESGLIDANGRILSGEKIPADAPDGIADAVVEFDGQPAVILADKDETLTGEPLLLTQKDVRELQLAKGAIAAGISVAAEVFGIDPKELDLVMLAGGFGNFLRRSSAKRIGLLPDLPTEKIEFIGNAALIGARSALTCRCCREQARRLSRKIEYIELAAIPQFQMHYMESMIFPESG